MRLIDADVLKYALGCSDEAMRFDAMIDEMPTINLSPVWTPCSEGLPDGINVNVLAAVMYGQQICTEIMLFHNKNCDTWCNSIGAQIKNERVLAWQHLPEPYKPDHIVDANKKVGQKEE